MTPKNKKPLESLNARRVSYCKRAPKNRRIFKKRPNKKAI
jgi:hypothetical protein